MRSHLGEGEDTTTSGFNLGTEKKVSDWRENSVLQDHQIQKYIKAKRVAGSRMLSRAPLGCTTCLGNPTRSEEGKWILEIKRKVKGDDRLQLLDSYRFFWLV